MGRSRKGRPPKFVHNPNGRPIVGLSYNKTTDRYYATYSKPRIWLGSDFKTALFQFQKYLSKQKEDEAVVEIYVPQTIPTYHTNGEIDWLDIPDEPVVIPAAYAGDTTSIPEILLFQKAREIILSDPIAAATKLGIPELSRLDDLPRLEKPLTLKAIFEFYVDHRNPSKDETRKAESFFNEFIKVVGVKTIREVTCDMVHDYKDKYWNEYKERNLSYHWLRGRFTKVKTVLNYSKNNGRTNKNELSRVLDWCNCLSVPADDATVHNDDIYILKEL